MQSSDTTYARLDAATQVSAPDEGGRTPLHTAAVCCRHDIAEMLISARADLEAKTLSTPTQGFEEWTPLLLACFMADADFVDMLICNDADVGQILFLGGWPGLGGSGVGGWRGWGGWVRLVG